MKKRFAAAVLAAAAVPALALSPAGPATAAAPAPQAASTAVTPPPSACTYPPGRPFQFTASPAYAKVRKNATIRVGSTLKRNGYPCRNKSVRYYVKPSGKRTYAFVATRRTTSTGKSSITRRATKAFYFSARYYEGRRKVATSRTGRVVLKR